MIRIVTCPICDRPLISERQPEPPPTFPFCSVRCRQIDLQRWFDAKYQIVEPMEPGSAVPPEIAGDGVDEESE
jgi:endogenous inhibitor of DNA gyrase (YacG/DUF329 family)